MKTRDLGRNKLHSTFEKKEYGSRRIGMLTTPRTRRMGNNSWREKEEGDSVGEVR